MKRVNMDDLDAILANWQRHVEILINDLLEDAKKDDSQDDIIAFSRVKGIDPVTKEPIYLAFHFVIELYGRVNIARIIAAFTSDGPISDEECDAYMESKHPRSRLN